LRSSKIHGNVATVAPAYLASSLMPLPSRLARLPRPRPTPRLAAAAAALAGFALAPGEGRAQLRAPASTVARVALDSVVVEVEHGSGRVLAETPAGAFRVMADAATLSAWAEAGAKLRPPRPSADSGKADFDAIALRDAPNAVVMRLARLGTDSLPAIQLDLADAAFSYTTLLSPPQWQRLRGALAGEWRDTVPNDCPAVRACYEFETDQPATPDRGNAAPFVPGVLRQSVGDARVLVEFVVGVDGRPRGESIMVRKSPHPLFAREVREAVLRWRFTPARKGGRAVPVQVLQPIEVRVR
jgi:TonB family protein